MSNFQYTADILADAFFRSGENPSNAADYEEQAIRYLNNLYYQICRGGSELIPSIHEDWVWLRKPSPGLLALQAPITTGTASVVRGDATVTLTVIPVDYINTQIAVTYWFFKLQELPEVYRVASHTAPDTTFELDMPYLGPTASGLSYTLFKLDYDLASDCMRLIAPMRAFQNSGWNSRDDYKIYTCDLDTLEEQYPLSLMERGIPDFFSPIGETTAGTKRVRFNRCGGPDRTTVYRIEYEYLYRPTPLSLPGMSEEPVLPLQFRSILADYLAAYLLGVKNDDRAGSVAQMAAAGLQGMATENRYQTTTATKNSFRLMPRESGRRRPGPLRTESGTIIG